MPKFDIEEGLAPGVGPSDAAITAFFRQLLPDFYFVNTPLSRMRRHLELLERLSTERVIVDFHRPPGAQFSELTLCAYDAAEPGLLSKVAGTLTALKINVHTAWIHTLADPLKPKGGDDVVLDTLILSEPYFGRTRPLSQRTQANIRQKLKAVLDGTTTVHQLLAWRTRKPYQPLRVYELHAADAPGNCTLIKLRAADDNGVLYRVTRALAELDLNIAHAQINTFEKAVDDVFFVRNTRGMLTHEEAESALSRLRAILQSEGLIGTGGQEGK